VADWTAARVLTWRDAVGADLLDRVHALVMAKLPPDHEVWRAIRDDAALASRVRGMLPGVQRRVEDTRDAAMGKIQVSKAKRALDPPHDDAQPRHRPRQENEGSSLAETRPAHSADVTDTSSSAGSGDRSGGQASEPHADLAPVEKPRVPLFQAPGTSPASPTRGNDERE
jgi:hypothetical protein